MARPRSRFFLLCGLLLAHYARTTAAVESLDLYLLADKSGSIANGDVQCKINTCTLDCDNGTYGNGLTCPCSY